MRFLALLGTIVILLACGLAQAQEPTDFLDLESHKIPLTLSLDRLGIVVKHGTTADQVRNFAETRRYKIAQELGGMDLLDIGCKADRAELAKLLFGNSFAPTRERGHDPTNLFHGVCWL